MKLLQAMAGAQNGGAEEFFVRLALAFEQSEVDQRVVIRAHPYRKKRLDEGGVETDTVRFGRWFDIHTRQRLNKIIRDYEPDIMLTWMSRASHVCPRPTKLRHFVRVARIGGYYKLKYFRQCDHLILNTPGLVQYVCDLGWPEERAHYLPNFVSERRAPPLDRKFLNTPAGVPIILGLGRLHNNKGFDVLLESMTRLPGHWLWLAGDGPERGSLEAQAARLGVDDRVKFIGWHNDVAPLFASVDMLVIPSRSEPLGNVVLEAWAQCVPVVAAAAQGLQQLIVDGVDGLLTPVNDSRALADTIREINGTRARSLAEAGWERYRKSYSEATVVSQYLDFFRTLTA